MKCTVELENSGKDVPCEDIKVGFDLKHGGSSVFTFGRISPQGGGMFAAGSLEMPSLCLRLTSLLSGI